MSETFGPLDHYPGILERARELIDLQVQLRDRPGVTGVRLWGSRHPHHLYGPRTNSGMGGATPNADANQRVVLNRARPNEITLSNSFRRGRFRYDEVTRGICRFIQNVTDVVGPPSISDDQVLYAAIQQERATLPEVTVDGFTGRANRIKGVVDLLDPILGPILVIPTVEQWTTLHETTQIIQADAPALGIGAVAMAVGGTPAPDPDLQIPNPLHFVLARPTTSITIRNLEAAPGTGLLVSHGLGQAVYEIPAGEERTYFGAVKEVCLMANAAAALASFEIEANLNLGGAAGGR